MAQAFGLVKSVLPPDGGDGMNEAYRVRGESLQMKHTQLPTLPKPSDHQVVNIRGDAEWWQVVDVQPDFSVDKRKGKPDEKPYKVLRLHSFCDWYITDINDSFAKKFGKSHTYPANLHRRGSKSNRRIGNDRFYLRSGVRQ